MVRKPFELILKVARIKGFCIDFAFNFRNDFWVGCAKLGCGGVSG